MQEAPSCRICRDGPQADRPLFHPCKCSGSIRHVHQECLEAWLSQSRTKTCELCGYQFKFTPVFTDSAPLHPTVTDLILGLVDKFTPVVLPWGQKLLASVVWIWILPVLARWSFRFFFEDWYFPWDASNPLSMDWLIGSGVCVIILAIMFSLLLYRDFVMMNLDYPDPFAVPTHEEVQAYLQRHANEEANEETQSDTNTEMSQSSSQLEEYGIDQISDLHQLLSGRLEPTNPHQDRSETENSNSHEASNTTTTDSERNDHFEGVSNGVAEDIADTQASGTVVSASDLGLASGGLRRRVVTKRDDNEQQKLMWTEKPGVMLQPTVGNGSTSNNSYGDEDVENIGYDHHSWAQRSNYQTMGNTLPLMEHNEKFTDSDHNGGHASLFNHTNRISTETNSTDDYHQFQHASAGATDSMDDHDVRHIQAESTQNARREEDTGNGDGDDNQEHDDDDDEDEDEDEDDDDDGDGDVEQLVLLEQMGFQGPVQNLYHSFFWVALMLNVMIFVICFVPYLMGTAVLWAIDYSTSSIPVGITMGYLVAALGAVAFHCFAEPAVSLLTNRLVAFVTTYLKVHLSLCIEVMVMPVIVGVTIDLMTLRLFGSSLQKHIELYENSPYTFLFVFGILGLLFMQCTTLCILEIRKVLNKGVFWFFIDPEDPEFHPFLTLSKNSILKNALRIVILFSMYIIIAFFAIWLPTTLAFILTPFLLPLRIIVHHSAELLWFIWAIPKLLDSFDRPTPLMGIFTTWAEIVSPYFGLRDYLFPPKEGHVGDVPENIPGEYTTSGIIRGVIFTFTGFLSLAAAMLLVMVAPVGLGRAVLATFTSVPIHDSICLYVGAKILLKLYHMINHFIHGDVMWNVVDCIIEGSKVYAVAFILYCAFPAVVGVASFLAFWSTFLLDYPASLLHYSVLHWTMGFLICSFVPLLRLAMNITREQETALLQGPIAARLQLTMKYAIPLVLYLAGGLMWLHAISFGLLPRLGIPVHVVLDEVRLQRYVVGVRLENM